MRGSNPTSLSTNCSFAFEIFVFAATVRRDTAQYPDTDVLGVHRRYVFNTARTVAAPQLILLP